METMRMPKNPTLPCMWVVSWNVDQQGRKEAHLEWDACNASNFLTSSLASMLAALAVCCDCS